MQLVWYRGKWYVREGRKRISLHTTDRDEALRRISDLKRERLAIGRSETTGTVAGVLDAYLEEKKDRPSIAKMRDAVKALKPYVGHLRPDQIDKSVCREYRKKRKASDGTKRKELGLLQAALRLAGFQVKLELPPFPAPRDVFITKEEFERLVENAEAKHIKTFLYLAWYTAARKEAILSLEWDAVDFKSNQIGFGKGRGNKGRSKITMAATLRKWLRSCVGERATEFVVEWGGSRVGNIRKGFKRAANNAGLVHITPHDLRRSAARKMIEAGTPIEVVAQYLGHTNTAVTYSTYARFAPSSKAFLKAAKALE